MPFLQILQLNRLTLHSAWLTPARWAAYMAGIDAQLEMPITRFETWLH